MGDEHDGGDVERHLIIDVTSAAGETRLTLTGDVDIAGEIDLRAEAAAISDYKPRRLTIDLRDVGFIDVRGAASLTALIRTARASGAEVTVVVTPKIREALDRMGSETALE